MRKIDWKDLGIRALKTFVQTFISYLTIDGVFDISNGNQLKRFALTTGLSALAGAISAVWNLILDVVSTKAGEAVDKIGDDNAADDNSETLSDTITESDWTYSDDNNAESEWTSADDGDIMDDEEEVSEDTIDGVDANG